MTANRIVIPFQRWHLSRLQGKGAETLAGEFAYIGIDEQIMLEKLDSWTGMRDDEPVFCAGTVQHWPGRSTVWAYIHKDAAPHMLWISRIVLNHLAKVPGRIECTVRCDFEKGHRWAEMLGFSVETPLLRAYGPEGEDHTGYTRFN